MNTFNIARAVLLGLLILLSFVTIGLAGSILSTIPPGDIPLPFVQLDVAVPVLSLVVVIPSLVIDYFRKGAFTSMVVVELSWTSVLSILWIAAAGATTGTNVNTSCAFTDIYTDITQCHLAQGLIGLTWICFLILLGWNTTLFVYAFMAQSRGNGKVWTSPVTGTNLVAYSSPSMAKGMQSSHSLQPMIPIQQQQIPQQQYQAYQGYPQGYPPTGYNAAPPQQHYPPLPRGTAQV